MNKILITGGVGYVGRELARQLLLEGDCEVHVLDNLACGEHRLRQMDLTKIAFHRFDICDVAAVKALMKKINPDLVYHLAAIHYIPACDAAPAEAAAVNIVGTVNLLNAVRDGTRFVYASSAAVYTPGDRVYTEDAQNVGPVDVYGFTKLHGEHFVRLFHEQGKIGGIIVRLFNVVGPGETNPHLVPAIMGQIGRGARSVQLGNLFPKRDYVDVRDAAEGFRRLAAAAGSPPTNGPLISNLGTGRSHSVREIVEQIGLAAGVGLEIAQDPARMRTNDRPLLCASTDILKAITGWAPTRKIEDSLRAAWNARIEDGFT